MTKPKKTFYFNTKKNWQNQYNTAKENLRLFNLALADLYSIKDLENRAFKLKELQTEYGPLDRYVEQQKENLNAAKQVLTSRYVISGPYALTDAAKKSNVLKYTNNAGETLETSDLMGGVETVGTSINPFYDEKVDLKSEYHVKKRAKDGGTYEEDVKTQNQNEFTEAFHYGTAGNTDAWGRDYDHPDYGIDPSSINRTIVTPTPVGNNNNNNNNEVVTDTGEANAGTTETNTKTNEVVNTNTSNLGAKEGDLIAAANTSETSNNRLELMTKSITDNPSRIQEDLIKAGFTPKRLAGLKIKHQDWKAERRNRKNLQVEATT